MKTFRVVLYIMYTMFASGQVMVATTQLANVPSVTVDAFFSAPHSKYS